MRWNDDAIYHRIRAHKADPDVYDPPTFEQMADRIEKLIAENKRINDQITEKQHAAKNGGDNMTKFTAEQHAILEDSVDFSPNGLVTYNGDLEKVVGNIWGNVQGSVQGNIWGDVKGNIGGKVWGDVWGNNDEILAQILDPEPINYENEMYFTYTPKQAEKLSERWNKLANARNQITADDVHYIFGESADHDIATDGATLVVLRAMHSATGAPTAFCVTRQDVNAPKYLATISHHSISSARSVPVGNTLHAAKINATREFGVGYLDHVIKIIEVTGGEERVVASRRVSDKRWTTS